MPSYLPGPYARMIPIDGRFSLDGAWQLRTPVVEARADGIDRVIAVVSDPAGRLLRGYPIERPTPIPDWVRVLSPPEPVPIEGFCFEPERTRAAFDLGRRAGDAFVDEHADWIAGREPASANAGA